MSHRQWYFKDEDGVYRWHAHPSSGGAVTGRDIPATRAYNKPLVSVGAGCHSSQVDEFRAHARGAGLTGVDFTPTGEAVFSSRGQRREYLKLRGLVDRDGGYGD